MFSVNVFSTESNHKVESLKLHLRNFTQKASKLYLLFPKILNPQQIVLDGVHGASDFCRAGCENSASSLQ
jgi:hypothetical protein